MTGQLRAEPDWLVADSLPSTVKQTLIRRHQVESAAIFQKRMTFAMLTLILLLLHLS